MSTHDARWMLVAIFGAASAAFSPTHAEAGNYTQVIFADDPVGYWRMNETSLPTAFNAGSGSGINGTYVNFGTGAGPGNIGQAGPRPTDTIGGQPLLGFNSDNRAPDFDGSSSHVIVGDTSNGPLDITGGVTVEAWVNFDSLTQANGGIAAKANTGAAGDQRSYGLFYQQARPGSGPSFLVNSSGAAAQNLIVDGSSAPVGEWLHVVGVYQPGTRLSLYLNGVEDAFTTTGVPASLFNGDSDFSIGTFFGTSNVFDGGIDHVAVYDRALTATEIMDHFQAAFQEFVVPEPSSLGLTACGLLLLGGRRRRRAV